MQSKKKSLSYEANDKKKVTIESQMLTWSLVRTKKTTNMEQILDNQSISRKIYKEKAIWVGTFLGGPLVAGYLIAENFKVFNQNDRVKKTWIYSIIATVVIFGGAFSIPENVKIPNQIIPLIYTLIAYQIVQIYQKAKIATYINSGGQFYSWWRTVLVGLIGLIVTIIPIFVFVMLTDTTANIGADTKTYGIMKHEISFDKDNISEAEVNKLADAFISTTFFDQAVTKYVYVKKLKTNLEISISCDKSVTSSPEALYPFIELRNDMQKLFPNNKIVFNLVVDSLDNIVKRLE